MLGDLPFSWRTHRWFVVIPLLLVACVGVVVMSAFGDDTDQPTALRTDSAPTTTSTTAAPIDTQPAAAPELSAAAENSLVVTTDDATTSTDASVTTTAGSEENATDSSAADSSAVDSSADDSSVSTDPAGAETTETTETDGAGPATETTPTEQPDPAVETTTPPTTEQPTTQPPAGSDCQSDGQFELVFRDDFNGNTLGSAWREYNSIGNNGFGLRRPAANSVANGMLTITAEMVDGQLVSGGMAHNYDQQYGKYVFRVRTDDDPDQATSGVILTWPESQVHPRDGENNIYETLAHTPQRTQFFSVIHKPFGQKGDQEYFIHSANGAVFQTMTMEWLPGRITITRQGESPGDRETVEVIETEADLIPDNPHHVAIQLDAWKQQMSTTVKMEVDYIEVHRYCG